MKLYQKRNGNMSNQDWLDLGTLLLKLGYVVSIGKEKQSGSMYRSYIEIQGNGLEKEASAYCEKCRQEVYHGEARFQWEGRWLCPDCFRAAVNKALRDCPEQVALEMGLEVERYV